MKKNKKPILTRYIDHTYYMEEERAGEFEQLFDTLLLLLKLNRNLQPDIVSHNFYNLTLYARNMRGDSDFSFRLDGTLVQSDGGCYAVDFQVKIVTDIDLTQIEPLNVNYNYDIYSMTFLEEEDFLNFMKKLVQYI
jgi:hypothetical protein